MSRFPKLATVIRSAAVAIALGGATFAAAPAMAAPAPHIDFHFGFGGGGLFWGFENGHRRYCLSDRQVRRFLQWQGYDHIRYTDRRGRIVSVRAERGRWEYRIRVDSCRAHIISIKRLRHHR